MRCLVRSSALRVLFLASGAPLFAGDWYVDAVNGSNQNGGTNWSDAWRTITHAVDTVPIYHSNRIYIASGTYDAALGESFPIEAQTDQQFLGDGGDEPPVIDAGNSMQAVIEILDALDVVVEGVVVRGGRWGIRHLGYESSAVVRDVTFADQSDWAYSVGSGAFDSAYATLERVRIEGGKHGIDVFEGYEGSTTLTITDSRISGLTGDGIEISGAVSGVIQRTRVTGNGGVGILVDGSYEPASPGILHLEDSLVARNRGGGVLLTGLAFADITRSTIADNFGPGLELNGDEYGENAEFDGSILHGNADDLLIETGSVTARFCNIGDGDFAGSNGNISADPLFLAPGQGDYRLRWGSPCIEAGDPATRAGLADLEGLLRPIDGDLDTQEAHDMGAHEFGPLARLKPVQVHDGYLRLRLWGEDGKSTVLWAAPTALVSPQSTPFGEYDLAAGAFRFGIHPVASFPPHVVQLRLWMTLIGRTYSFQALTESSVAPQGAAWTNPIEFTLWPD